MSRGIAGPRAPTPVLYHIPTHMEGDEQASTQTPRLPAYLLRCCCLLRLPLLLPLLLLHLQPHAIIMFLVHPGLVCLLLLIFHALREASRVWAAIYALSDLRTI